MAIERRNINFGGPRFLNVNKARSAEEYLHRVIQELNSLNHDTRDLTLWFTPEVLQFLCGDRQPTAYNLRAHLLSVHLNLLPEHTYEMHALRMLPPQRIHLSHLHHNNTQPLFLRLCSQPPWTTGLFDWIPSTGASRCFSGQYLIPRPPSITIMMKGCPWPFPLARASPDPDMKP